MKTFLSTPKLKICGVRSPQMLAACRDERVDFIGLNFVPTSRRKISAEFLRKSTKFIQEFQPKFKTIGVFQDQPIEFIIDMIEQGNLDGVQFHGDESSDFLQTVKEAYPQLLIWKSITPANPVHAKNFSKYLNLVNVVLFDSSEPGTGRTLTISPELTEMIRKCNTRNIRYAIAGGIKPGNVPFFYSKFSDAYAFDTASGVESDGMFSAEKLNRFIQKLKNPVF